MALTICLAKRPTDGKGFMKTGGIRGRHRWDGDRCRWCGMSKAESREMQARVDASRKKS
jgi:hypothetical protein